MGGRVGGVLRLGRRLTRSIVSLSTGFVFSPCFLVLFFFSSSVRLFDGGTGKGAGSLDFFDLEDAAVSGENKINIGDDMVEKWWCLGGRENRIGMWVQGRWLSH